AEPGAPPASDEASPRNGRHVVEDTQQLERLQALQYAQTECRAPNSPTGERKTHQALGGAGCRLSLLRRSLLMRRVLAAPPNFDLLQLGFKDLGDRRRFGRQVGSEHVSSLPDQSRPCGLRRRFSLIGRRWRLGTSKSMNAAAELLYRSAAA